MERFPRLKIGKSGLLSAMLVMSVFAVTSVGISPAALRQDAYAGTFPGSNGKIAYDTGPSIYLINPDGTGNTELTNNPAGVTHPSWSPDGTKIAFVKTEFAGSSDRDIFVINADGSGEVRLTDNDAFNDDPSWSPDGTKIAFSTDRDGDRAIYVMNPDGTSQTRVSANGSSHGNPSWSPDGTKIAFSGGGDVHVMNTDGSGVVTLANNDGFTFSDNSPSWSPDGTKIAFVSDRDGDSEIFVMNADGSGQTQLTFNTSFDSYPSWSPDGTKIAFFSSRTGNSEIFVMNTDGSLQSNITVDPGNNGNPDWGPGPAPPGDTTPPTIEAPADITLECNFVDGFSGTIDLGTPSVSDNEDPSPLVTHSPDPVPNFIAIPGITVTWTATDESNNSASDDQAINVVDTTPPTLTVPPDIEITLGDSTDPSATGLATATDVCDSSVDISYTDGPVAADNTFIRTWTASDGTNQSTGTQKILLVIPVDIDIKPSNFPNSINLKKETTISLAVFGSATFDVKQAVINTIRFGDLGTDPGAIPKSNKGSYSDVNRDGFLDLILKFSTPQTGIDPGDVQACLKGKLLNGSLFKGCDSVRTV